MNNLKDIRKELASFGSKEKAAHALRFFRTGEGEYGEGDRFLGVSVPETRAIAKKYFKELGDDHIAELVGSPMHEERLLGLIMWTYQMEEAQKARNHTRINAIAQAYLKNRAGVNNWDLVDVSCYKILGPMVELKGKYETPTSGPRHVVKKEKKGFTPPADEAHLWTDEPLEVRKVTDPATLNTGNWLPKNPWAGFGQLRSFAQGGNLWEKRIAMVTTYYFIKQNSLEPTIEMAQILLGEKHDLLQKAVGWMLREMGKVDEPMLTAFLKRYHSALGRTALRYAIEKFTEARRQAILKGRVV